MLLWYFHLLKRKDIYESNKEYEQLIFDTETEEY
jgi:hypothetical protein